MQAARRAGFASLPLAVAAHSAHTPSGAWLAAVVCRGTCGAASAGCRQVACGAVRRSRDICSTQPSRRTQLVRHRLRAEAARVRPLTHPRAGWLAHHGLLGWEGVGRESGMMVPGGTALGGVKGRVQACCEQQRRAVPASWATATTHEPSPHPCVAVSEPELSVALTWLVPVALAWLVPVVLAWVVPVPTGSPTCAPAAGGSQATARRASMWAAAA